MTPVFAAASASASTPSVDLVASGTVDNASGQAMPGAVVDLYAWPPQQILKTLKPGQKVPETMLSTATASTTGAYSLSVSPSALKPHENAAGYTNLEVDSGGVLWGFPVLAAHPGAVAVPPWSRSSCRLRRVDLSQRHERQPGHGRPGVHRQRRRHQGNWYHFHYGSSQSSSLGFGISYGGATYGSFHDKGSNSVSTGATQHFPKQTKPSLIADRTKFANGLYYRECGPRGPHPAGMPPLVVSAKHKWKAPKCPLQGGGTYCDWKVMANDWIGGGYPVSVKRITNELHWVCVNEPKGSGWSTQNAKAVTLQAGFGLPEVGVSLTAQTGFSDTAKQEYQWNNNGQLCGNTRPSHAGVLVML